MKSICVCVVCLSILPAATPQQRPRQSFGGSGRKRRRKRSRGGGLTSVSKFCFMVCLRPNGLKLGGATFILIFCLRKGERCLAISLSRARQRDVTLYVYVCVCGHGVCMSV